MQSSRDGAIAEISMDPPTIKNWQLIFWLLIRMFPPSNMASEDFARVPLQNERPL